MCVYVHFESMSFLFEFLRCGSLIYVITNTIADVIANVLAVASVRVRFMSLMLDIMKEAQSRDESEWIEVKYTKRRTTGKRLAKRWIV
jgi:hypothetical protein